MKNIIDSQFKKKSKNVISSSPPFPYIMRSPCESFSEGGGDVRNYYKNYYFESPMLTSVKVSFGSIFL